MTQRLPLMYLFMLIFGAITGTALCYNPELLLIGDPVKVVLTAVTAFAGIPLLAAGLENYLWFETNPIQRLLLIAGGLLLILPVHIAAIPSAIVGLIPVVWQWMRRRQVRIVTRPYWTT